MCGLVRAAPGVVKVCETTEKCFQRLLNVTGVPCSKCCVYISHHCASEDMSEKRHIFLPLVAILSNNLHNLCKQIFL